jgi:type IV pilus assembly protein PilV
MFKYKLKIKQKGFTLIEVMIAIVVFSFGLLGVAGVMTVAVKNNHNGYMRTQAAFLTTSIIDMMRRNQLGVFQGLYDGTYAGYSSVSSACVSGIGCDYAGLAARDVSQWSNMITQFLPNSSGTVQCTAGAAPTTPIPVMIPNPLDPTPSTPSLPLVACQRCAIEPYSGFCDITITWTESNEIGTNSTQSYTVKAKP